jgi:hypothetical protein
VTNRANEEKSWENGFRAGNHFYKEDTENGSAIFCSPFRAFFMILEQF